MEYCTPSFHMYFLLKHGSCETVLYYCPPFIKKRNKVMCIFVHINGVYNCLFHCFAAPPHHKSNAQLCVSISLESVSFHCQIILFLCQYYTIFIIKGL